jgi:hypothetical protein
VGWYYCAEEDHEVQLKAPRFFSVCPLLFLLCGEEHWPSSTDAAFLRREATTTTKAERGLHSVRNDRWAQRIQSEEVGVC